MQSFLEGNGKSLDAQSCVCIKHQEIFKEQTQGCSCVEMEFSYPHQLAYLLHHANNEGSYQNQLSEMKPNNGNHMSAFRK